MIPHTMHTHTKNTENGLYIQENWKHSFMSMCMLSSNIIHSSPKIKQYSVYQLLNG